MRDSQKTKVYHAEWDMQAKGLVGKRFETLPAIDRWVNSIVLQSSWFKKHFPNGPGELHIKTKKKGKALGSIHYLVLPPWAWTKLTILHELTHGVVWLHYGNYKHSWPFTRTYLKIVKHFLGKQYYDELRVQYKRLRVKYRKPPVLSEARLEQLQTQGAKLAAGRGFNA